MRDAEPAPGRRRPSWSLPGRVAATAAVAIQSIKLENEGWERDTSVTEPKELSV